MNFIYLQTIKSKFSDLLPFSDKFSGFDVFVSLGCGIFVLDRRFVLARKPGSVAKVYGDTSRIGFLKGSVIPLRILVKLIYFM